MTPATPGLGRATRRSSAATSACARSITRMRSRRLPPRCRPLVPQRTVPGNAMSRPSAPIRACASSTATASRLRTRPRRTLVVPCRDWTGPGVIVCSVAVHRSVARRLPRFRRPRARRRRRPAAASATTMGPASATRRVRARSGRAAFRLCAVAHPRAGRRQDAPAIRERHRNGYKARDARCRRAPVRNRANALRPHPGRRRRRFGSNPKRCDPQAETSARGHSINAPVSRRAAPVPPHTAVGRRRAQRLLFPGRRGPVRRVRSSVPHPVDQHPCAPRRRSGTAPRRPNRVHRIRAAGPCPDAERNGVVRIRAGCNGSKVARRRFEPACREALRDEELQALIGLLADIRNEGHHGLPDEVHLADLLDTLVDATQLFGVSRLRKSPQTSQRQMIATSLGPGCRRRTQQGRDALLDLAFGGVVDPGRLPWPEHSQDLPRAAPQRALFDEPRDGRIAGRGADYRCAAGAERCGVGRRPNRRRAIR